MFGDVFRIRPAGLHCDRLDGSTSLASGYLSPPSRPLVGALNFGAIESWSDVRSERLHGGDIVFRPGYDMDSWRHLGMEQGWDESPFRNLHVCFLRRSSSDPEHVPGTGRANLAETRAFRRGLLGPPERLARRTLRRAAAVGPRPGKRTNTAGGIGSRSTCPRSSHERESRPSPERDRRHVRVAGSPRRRARSARRSTRAHVRGDRRGRRVGCRDAGDRRPLAIVFDGKVVHSWQPNTGYRRARSLNLAVLGAAGDYLVVLDGDCLARRGCIEAVRRAALPGWFLASKRLNMSAELSRRVLEQHVPVWRWSAARWFATAPREVLSAPREVARPGLLLPVRDRRRPWRPEQPDFAPPFDGYGFFFGVERRDLERVNGFDMRFDGLGWRGRRSRRQASACRPPVRLARRGCNRASSLAHGAEGPDEPPTGSSSRKRSRARDSRQSRAFASSRWSSEATGPRRRGEHRRPGHLGHPRRLRAGGGARRSAPCIRGATGARCRDRRGGRRIGRSRRTCRRPVAGTTRAAATSGNRRKASARRARSIEPQSRPAATTSSSSTPIASRGRGFWTRSARARDPAGSSRRSGCMLGESFSRRVVDERLPIWRWTAFEWLVRAPREVGRPGYLVPVRDRRRPWRPTGAEFVPPDLGVQPHRSVSRRTSSA